MNKNLTYKQSLALGFIVSYVHENKIAPRLQDMADELGMGQTMAHKHIKVLEEKGYIRRLGGARSIIVL